MVVKQVELWLLQGQCLTMAVHPGQSAKFGIALMILTSVAGCMLACGVAGQRVRSGGKVRRCQVVV